MRNDGATAQAAALTASRPTPARETDRGAGQSTGEQSRRDLKKPRTHEERGDEDPPVRGADRNVRSAAARG